MTSRGVVFDICFIVLVCLLQAQGGDSLSKVAWLAGIRLDKLMLDNTDVVRDLDAPVQGMQLLLCNPALGEQANSEASFRALVAWVAFATALEAIFAQPFKMLLPLHYQV